MSTQGRFLFSTATLILLAGFSANAQTRADCERAYTPLRAQEGKDVIWAPTEDSMVGRMLEMARVTAADKVYDLGAGDGKIVIAAAKDFGATGVGVEFDAELVAHARCLAAAEGVDERVTFVQADIFETDFSDATVVALYLTPSVNARLLPTLLTMTPGTRVVSYSFGIGEWPPDEQIDSFGDGSAFLFVVPATVAGQWTFRSTSGERSFDIELAQSFQRLTGDAGDAAVDGQLRGREIELRFTKDGARARLTGSVEGDRISATLETAGSARPYVGTRR